MREITLDQPKEVLKVNYGKETFSIPLAGSLPFTETVALREAKANGGNTIELMIGFMEKHIPEKIYKQLTADELKAIFKAWSDASEEASGVTPGEL